MLNYDDVFGQASANDFTVYCPEISEDTVPQQGVQMQYYQPQHQQYYEQQFDSRYGQL